jgi:hypothetical protein
VTCPFYLNICRDVGAPQSAASYQNRKWDRCFRIEFSGCGKADLQSVGHVFEQVSAMSPGWTLDPAIIFLTKKILARKMDPRVKPAGEDQTTLGVR